MVTILVATPVATFDGFDQLAQRANLLSLGETVSDWRDLNSRPLDPQTREPRYLSYPRVLAGVLLSVTGRACMALGDLLYSPIFSSLLAQRSHRRRR